MFVADDNEVLALSPAVQNRYYKARAQGEYLRDTARKLKNYANSIDDDAVRNRGLAMAKDLESGDRSRWPAPEEIANYGKETHSETVTVGGKKIKVWPGKKVMLGTSWFGRMEL
jgi:4-aminobutyrate aminotransferase-like enzyme